MIGAQGAGATGYPHDGNMRIPGPTSLLNAATTVRDSALDLVLDIPATAADVLDLLGRAGDLMGRVEGLVDRAEDMLERAEATFASVEGMLSDGEAMLDRAAGVLADAETTAAGAAETALAAADITREAGVTADAAAALVGGTGSLLQRGDALLAPLEALSQKALPSAQAFTNKLDQTEIDALIGMTDRLPVLFEHLESDILPMLGQLDRVGPDVRNILDAVQDISTALHGLPGAGLLLRRGERKEESGEHG